MVRDHRVKNPLPQDTLESIAPKTGCYLATIRQKFKRVKVDSGHSGDPRTRAFFLLGIMTIFSHVMPQT